MQVFALAAVCSSCRGLSDSYRNRQPRSEERNLSLLNYIGGVFIPAAAVFPIAIGTANREVENAIFPCLIK